MVPIVFREVPPAIEAEKDRKTDSVSVTGSAVAHSGLVQAVLRHGSSDRYYFLSSMFHQSEAERRLSAYGDAERAAILPVDGNRLPADLDHAILFTGSSLIPELAHLRSVLKRPHWPVGGVIHALSYHDGLPQALLMLLEQLYRFDCLVCTSRAGQTAITNIFAELSAALEERTGKKTSFAGSLPIIPLGVDDDEFRPGDRDAARAKLGLPEDDVVFLYVGRLSPTFKMDPFPLVLEFLRRVVPRVPNATLILAGNDTYEGTAGRLQEMAAELESGEKIRVLSNLTTSQKHLLYSAADVFVSLSDNVQETFGLTILEAMSCGLPVIATDWSGYRELIEHSITGFLVRANWITDTEWISQFAPLHGNPMTHWLLAQNVAVDFDAVVEYMTALATSSTLRNDMGAAGRRRVEATYSWREVVRKYEELWCESLTAAQTLAKTLTPLHHRLGSYRYEDIFQHYATPVPTQSLTLAVTNLGRDYVDGLMPVAPLAQDPPWMRNNFVQALDTLCRGTSESGFDDLVRKVRTEFGVPEAMIRISIARMVKYGLLKAVYPAS